MAIRFTNNAATTLSSGINASVTSIPLTDGSAFPALGPSDDYAYITIEDSNNTEVVKAIARSGDTLDVIRGQDGTTANAFASGEKVELRLPAIALNDVAEKYASYKLFYVPDGSYTFTGTSFVPDGKVLASGETWELLGDAEVTLIDGITSWDDEVSYYEDPATITGTYVFHNELLLTGDSVITLGTNASIVGFGGSTGPGVVASGGGGSGVSLTQVLENLSVTDETIEGGLGSLVYDNTTGVFTFTGTTDHTPVTAYATVLKYQF